MDIRHTFSIEEEAPKRKKTNDQSSIMNFDDTSRTGELLIKPSRKEEKIKSDMLNEFSRLDNPDDSMDAKRLEEIVQDEVNEVTPNDFGYFTLFHTGNEDLDHEIKNADQDELKDNEHLYYVPGNFLDNLNQADKNKRTVAANPMDILFFYSKNEKHGTANLNVENPFEIRERKENKIKNFTTKKMTNNPSMKDDNEVDELVKNTDNSRIQILQNLDLEEGKPEEAMKRNMDYVIKKVRYEVSLIEIQLSKWAEYSKNDLDHPVQITSEKPFKDLENQTEKFMKKFKQFEIEQNPKLFHVRSRLQQFSLESRSFLVTFMAGIIRAYLKSLNEKKSSNDKGKSYIKWKTKLSQLVGIWDLSNSNGTEIKCSYKYLILKRFLSLRASARQQNKNFIEIPEEKKAVLGSQICSIFSADENSVIHPIAVFNENDTLRTWMDIIVAICLLYSFVTVPLRLFLDVDNKNFKFLEKFVDMYFYMDIMLNFRTAFKDKFNEEIFDIASIAKRYFNSFFIIDFLSTIPWSFFFIGSPISDTIKLITHISKILRIIKLLPILSRLEQLKFANYFRLLKLLLIYFLMSHWMACILYSGLTETVIYNDSMNERCYTSNDDKDKFTLTGKCRYVITFYLASYMIPGQYTSYMQATEVMAGVNEYVVLVFEFLIAQFVAAYTFGGMTDIIQNLDQGSNFFTEKTDLLREHMLFYDMSMDVQNDVRVYYDYLWQRHKDIIYGKHHFSLLSKSLREKFENFNLLGNEIYLNTFHKLNNPKLIGHILREMKKIIVFPYEILYEEGSLVEGLYILTNGDIVFTTVVIENAGHSAKSVEFANVMREIEKRKNWKHKNYQELEKDYTVIFPLVSSFIKTGRTYQRCYAIDFADLLFLPLTSFDEIIVSFPVEMHSLKHEVMHDVEKRKLLDNAEIFKALAIHSARSIGKNFEKEYTKLSIWIPIPIPISQRKIATNYIESFVKKVKNQWREILCTCDLNICLNSMMVVGFLKSDKKNKNKKDDPEKNAIIQQGDQLDMLKNVARALGVVSDEFVKLFRDQFADEDYFEV